jgi:putative ABC transport system permease protein
MRFTRQLLVLLRMNLRSVPERAGLVVTISIGVACAVGVLVSMLAMGAGARREAMGNVRPDRVVLLSTGSQAPDQSSIPRDVARLIPNLPGIRQSAKGEPIAVSQVSVFVRARTKAADSLVGFTLAGVSTGLSDYMPELHLTAGRMFQPGLHEFIASNVCARKFANFNVGDRRVMRGGEWLVVGNFDIGRAQGICLAFTDADTVLSAFSRDTFNQVDVMLQSVSTFAEFTSAIKADPTLRVEAKYESDLAEESMKQFNGILNSVSYFLGAIMAVAATLGAANSLYAIVDNRRRELATLSAIGFSAAPIVASTIIESILLALPGALIGVGIAWLFFNGLTASPFGFSIHLAVTSSTAVLGVVWALAMGAIGGLLPAMRAARIPVTTALRGV